MTSVIPREIGKIRLAVHSELGNLDTAAFASNYVATHADSVFWTSAAFLATKVVSLCVTDRTAQGMRVRLGSTRMLSGRGPLH
jgi:hypothetical protein